MQGRENKGRMQGEDKVGCKEEKIKVGCNRWRTEDEKEGDEKEKRKNCKTVKAGRKRKKKYLGKEQLISR